MSRQISAATFLNTLKVRSEIGKIPHILLQFFFMETVSTIFIQCILFAIKIFIYNFNEVWKVSQLLAGVGKFMSRFSSKLVFSY